MNIWIITVGSSDVQLNSKEHWVELFRSVRSELDDRGFKPVEGMNKRFLVPARVMGTVYSQPQAEQYFDSDLEFPLLSNFASQLQDVKLDKVILVLTDQTSIFPPQARGSQSCPYWQDTHTLEPILKRYLNKKFSTLEIAPLPLQPQSDTKGVDDWDYILQLVQQEFRTLNFPEKATIYVSHQAGTPAVSSAIQFVSLAWFRKQHVKFLVSNEYRPELTKTIDESRYLRAIRLQEAKALLDRYDYSAVKELLALYLNPKIENSLNAAIQWNLAEFEEFAKRFKIDKDFEKDVQERTREENWWWTAYESAWLGVVRLEQDNTVEAMFHSFRSVEGLLRKWVDKFYSEEIRQTKHPRWQKHRRWDRCLRPYGEDLYQFLSIKRNIDKEQNLDIWIFGNYVFKKRNDLFHQLKGLGGRKILFEKWQSPNEKKWNETDIEKWRKRIFECLNFIAKDDLPENFSSSSLENVSLMAKVHKELKNAIAQLELHT